MPRIDLNADLGEHFGSDAAAEEDAALLDHVTSANIACGFHAGTPKTMARTVAAAAARGVALGAHPGLPDRANFGRLPQQIAPDAVYSLVLYQLGALAAFARPHRQELRHVKPHGALYHMAEADPAIAQAIARAAYDWDTQLNVFGLSGGLLIQTAHQQGLRTAAEVFADRTYQPDGALTPRSQPNALLHDPALIAQRMAQLVATGKLMAVDGTELILAADTLCLHSDTRGAAERARLLRAALEAQGFTLGPP